MKSTINTILSLSVLGIFTSCTFVDAPARRTQTTTTSEVAPAVYGTTETTTTRNY
jgi:hypothetical protein